MELRLNLHDPLYDEVREQAKRCGLPVTKYALEVLESFAAERRFWRIDHVPETIGTSRGIVPAQYSNTRHLGKFIN